MIASFVLVGWLSAILLRECFLVVVFVLFCFFVFRFFFLFFFFHLFLLVVLKVVGFLTNSDLFANLTNTDVFDVTSAVNGN